MSRGGRGGSTNTTGVRAIANVLGIARQDVGSFMQLQKEPPPTYPPLNRQTLPLNETPELLAATDFKLELLKRFHESPFYAEKRGQKEITRYTDKYNVKTKELDIDFSRIPSELNWTKKKGGQKQRRAKVRKLDDTAVADRLAKLEAAEKVEPEQDEEVQEEENADEEDGEKKPEANDDEEELSDDDYLEEDNDYVTSYFDNGERDGDSDDNLDEDHTILRVNRVVLSSFAQSFASVQRPPTTAFIRFPSVLMGIKDLSKVLADHAERAVREQELGAYFGRKVAIDASMSMYQFLIAIRHDNGQNLSNEKGESTSHLNGMFYRTIRLMENGLKPIFVFDGKPPELKSDELVKRYEKREEAKKELEAAKEKGDHETAEKYERRTVKVTPEQGDQCKALLRAMGVPVVEAPCEAEAQCAELVKKGKAFATGTEDMDALTFGSTVLLRHLTFSEAKKMPIKEYNLEKILENLGFTQEQFIDLCILLGCDYCSTIKGVGPKKAMELISKYKSIENVLENLDQEKFKVPANWNFAAARKLFVSPSVDDGATFQLKWTPPDEEAIMKLMVEEQGFNADRIKAGLARLKNTGGKSQQGRIDSFFQSTGTVQSTTALKRKAEEAAAKGAKKPKKGAAAKDSKKDAKKGKGKGKA
ncbi:Flap endonuclease 1-like protein [Aphelenchoides fujianensis]|nr:Flap endonuclease 1-like protein [Aphelenchoides fujianensis]